MEFVQKRSVYLWASAVTGFATVFAMVFVDALFLNLSPFMSISIPPILYLAIATTTALSAVLGLYFWIQTSRHKKYYRVIAYLGVTYTVLLIGVGSTLMFIEGDVGGLQLDWIAILSAFFLIPTVCGVFAALSNNKTLRIGVLILLISAIILIFSLSLQRSSEYRQSMKPDVNITITQASCDNVLITHNGGDILDLYSLTAKSRVDGNSSSVTMRLNRATPTPDANGYIRAKFREGDSISVNGVREGEIALVWTHPSGGVSFVLASSEIRGC